MYHFTADHAPEPVRLSFRALLPGHIRQYLKDFQIDAIRFMHNFLAKSEFCVYNDESGLGKQVATVALLDAACSSRKCLIVVQNDDRYVSGWEFHFNVLSKSNITIIKDAKDSTDSPHSIYIAKWSTLRSIDDLSKFKFDFIILDNRGQMLNNSFCTSMLLKHYERRINILISSVDITSDLKLFHNVLRLGGRLEPQYSSFKVFEEKFKLPDAKELAYKRVDLEEYFCKRERLADYCKTFRLRRYCHQFETQLPLVKEDRYRINLDLWREKQNATNSESSSVECLNPQNREDVHIRDTQELFEEYCRQRRQQHLQFQQEEEQRMQQRELEALKNLDAEKEIIYNVDDEVDLINSTTSIIVEKSTVRDNSDEPVLMSPLLVESDSDIDDIPEISHPIADIEIVDLSSEEKEDLQQNEETNNDNETNKQIEKFMQSSDSNRKVNRRKPFKNRSELERLQEDIVDTLKIVKAPRRLSRQAKNESNSMPSRKSQKNRSQEKNTYAAISKNKSTNYSLSKSTRNTKLEREYKLKKSPALKTKLEMSSKKNHEALPKVKENCTTLENTKIQDYKNSPRSFSTNSTSNFNSMEKGKNNSKDYINKIDTSPVTLRKRSVKNVENISNESSEKNNDNQIIIKKEVLEETSEVEKISSNDSQVRIPSGKKIRIKRGMDTSPSDVRLIHTRSMHRLTRSAGSSKYSTKNLSLRSDKKGKPKKVAPLKEAPKNTATNKKKQTGNCNAKQTDTSKNQKLDGYKFKNAQKNTQTSIISHRSSQDYESLQCAQRLSDAGVFDDGINKSTEFLVPPTPNVITRNSLIPSSLTSSTGLLAESDIMFINATNPNANGKREQFILLSSSDNENSISQSSSVNISMTSRRTRALKPKRIQQQIVSDINKIPNFSELLAQQSTRSSTKSPDLFSNCSDLVQLTCTQKKLDSAEQNAPFEGFKIFGSEVKQLQQHYAFNKSNTNKHNANLKKSHREQRSCLDILEKMFEPSNKKSKQQISEKLCTPTKSSSRAKLIVNNKKPCTSILPSHPIEAISEARQQREAHTLKRSAATISSALQDDDIFEITNNGTFGSVMRLHSNGDISPVQITQKTNAKQHNKITNYLIGNGLSCAPQEESTPNSGNSVSILITEAGTPNKRHQPLIAGQNNNVKKSPKGKYNSIQATKLTKWFTKPSEVHNDEVSVKARSSNFKHTPTKQVQVHQKVDQNLTSPVATKRILKRRRLDLSFNK